MHTTTCRYCTTPALGIDEDNHPTCGADTCTPVQAPYPVLRCSISVDGGKTCHDVRALDPLQVSRVLRGLREQGDEECLRLALTSALADDDCYTLLERYCKEHDEADLGPVVVDITNVPLLVAHDVLNYVEKYSSANACFWTTDTQAMARNFDVNATRAALQAAMDALDKGDGQSAIDHAGEAWGRIVFFHRI